MSRPRKERISLLLIGGLFSLIALNSCVDPIPPSSSQNKPTFQAVRQVLEHYSEEDGHVVWVMEADLVEFFESAQEARAENVSLIFNDENGEEVLTLTSDQLVFHMSTGDLAINGNIVAEDSSGMRLTTEEAYWNDEEGVLRGESPVSAEREDLSITGKGFAYNPKKKEAVIRDFRFQAILGGDND